MGGGDLNLKKSWHPHTLKNQEKVWKAEQAKQAEDSKLADLRREIEEERNREELTRIGQNSGVLGRGDGDKKLEWMYKSSTDLINRDEYLLGRKIDKSFEILQAEEKAAKTENLVGIKQQINHVEHECIPFSIRTYKNAQSTTEQVDMQRKVMEDPLMLIKQKEIESRRKLLENPVKLKELHRILKTEQMLKKANKEKSKKSKSKSSKKSKKKHKNKKSKKSKQTSSDSDSSSSSDSGEDLDKKLAKQYKKLQGDSGDVVGMSLSKLLNAKYDTISKELDKAVKTKRKKRQGSSESEGSEGGSSDYDEEGAKAAFRNQRGGGNQSQRFERSERRRSPQRAINRRSGSGSNSNYRGNASNRLPRSRSPYRRQQARSRSGSPFGNNNRRYNNNRSQYNDERNRRPYQDRQRQEKRERSSTPEKRQRNRSNERRGSPEKRQQQKTRERSRSAEKRQRNRSRERSRSVEKRQRKRSESPRNRQRSRNKSTSPFKPPKTNSTTQRNRSRSKSPPPPRKRSPSPKQSSKIPQVAPPSKLTGSKLTDEEKAAKLREMMENANWREVDRSKAVKKHREAYAKEEEQHNAREFDKDFINKEVKKAIDNHSNVGTRIRANLNNIQRTSSAMDANFARK